MNLSELVAQVEDNIGRDDKTEKISSYINLALERIHKDYSKFSEWQRTSTAEVQEDNRLINLPDEYGTINFLIFTNTNKKSPLKRIPRREYDRKYFEVYTDDYKKGEPELYTVWSDHIELYPVPDNTYIYILRWSRRPRKLEADSDIPAINCNNAIIEMATVIAYNRLGMPEEGQAHYQIYQSHLQAAIRREREKNSDTDYKLQPYKSHKQEVKERDVIKRSDFS